MQVSPLLIGIPNIVGIPTLTDTFKGIKGEKMESQKLKSKKDSHVLRGTQGGSETRVSIMVVLCKKSLLKSCQALCNKVVMRL